MKQLYEVARRVAKSPLSVLLLGETGVGKEVLAEELHRASPRMGQPLLRLNCAGFTESLLESELFGYEKGAFTGAVKAKPGLLESAHGGTVFLDEVGELPLGLQAKLLRVLEQREVQRLGELRPRPIDVRFVAATNRDLEEEIARGTFRQDLYFRLNGISLVIPPLRERPDEIEPLARALIAQACRTMRRPSEPLLTSEIVALLRRYHWPGNVRELKNAIDRAVVLCAGDVLKPEHFSLERLSAPLLSARPPARSPIRVGRTDAPPEAREGSGGQRERLLDALERCGGNQSEAAKLLGVSRKTLMA
jgi:transcriptional regulator with PAS, ATPase and Fis domain